MSNPRVARSRETLIGATLSLLDGNAGQLPTVTEVCERAGVSRPTFYQHFGDLSRLVAEAVTQRLDTAFTVVVPRPEEQTNASTVDVVRALLGLIMEDKIFYRGVLGGPAALAVQRHIASYLAERLVTVSPFAAQLQEVDNERVIFLSAGTTQLLVDHLFDDSSTASIKVTATRASSILTSAATALSAAPSRVPEELQA
jgi:AcrR family transcriptional regulator